MKKKRASKPKGTAYAEYGRRIGVSRQMVQRYVELGMPTLDGKRIDPVKADKWREENIQSPADETFADARRRKESALASLRELELKKAGGGLVDRAKNDKALFGIFRQLRDGLLLIPTRTAATLAIETDHNKIHTLLTKEIRELLHATADQIEGR
jgi:hypothetical protein